MNHASLRFLLVWLGCWLVGCGSSGSDDVTCATTSDCSGADVCRDSKCVGPTSCSSSNDCGNGFSCDAATSLCVDCLTGRDCSAGATCLGNVCRAACDVDKDCEKGTQCGPRGYCVECVDDTGCSTDEYCREGSCVADTCEGRSSVCSSSSSVSVCSERGDTSVELRCSSGNSCSGEPGRAWCDDWICLPNQATCSADRNFAETCSADGLSLASTVDCGADDSICVEGACQPIICDAYQSFCRGGDLYDCNSLGTIETIADVCSANEYCDEDATQCQPQICEPGENGCVEGELGTCNADGSGYEDLQACENDEICEEGECRGIVCTPGATFCDDDGHVHWCNATGTSSSITETCASSQYCREGSGYAFCAQDICTPGQPACSGSSLGTCNTAGSGVDGPFTDCSTTGQVCEAGSCQTPICTDGMRLCLGGDVHLCGGQGTWTTLYDNCTSTEFCDEVSFTCKTRVCTPGALSCSGSTTRTCKADGSGWTNGTDCSTTGDACEAGVCKDIVCTPSSTFCDGNSVRSCNSLGTTNSLYSNCSTGAHCWAYSSTTASCRTDVCPQGTNYCSSNVALTCNADGSAPVDAGQDCTATGDACWAGSCADVLCTNGQKLCSGGDHYNCTNNGTSMPLLDDCTSSEYCNATSGCLPQVCTPGAPACSGSYTLTSCLQDGSGYAPGGVDCSNTQDLCYDGSCRNWVCYDNEWSCNGKQLYRCTDLGTLNELVDTCSAEETCDATREACVKPACTPGSQICSWHDQVKTCEVPGTHYSVNSVSCAAGELCDGGDCFAPSALCSLEDTSWGNAVDIDAAIPAVGLQDAIIRADGEENLFVLWRSAGSSSGIFVRRYDHSSGIWDPIVQLGNEDGVSLAKLAVSANGSAMVLYQSSATTTGGVFARYYDAPSKTWQPKHQLSPQSVGYFVNKMSLVSDDSGRFLAVWAASSLRTAFFVPEDGWSTPSIMETWDNNNLPGFSLDMTPAGYAAMSWARPTDKSLRWNRFNFDDRVWTGTQLVDATTVYAATPPHVRVRESNGSAITIVHPRSFTYGGPGSVVMFEWNDQTGFSSSTLSGVSVAPNDVAFTAAGDEILLSWGDAYRRPAGQSHWDAYTGVSQLSSNLLAFPSGELLAFNVGANYGFEAAKIVEFVQGSWQDHDFPSLYDVLDVVPLSRCRAVAVLKVSDGSNVRVNVSFRQ